MHSGGASCRAKIIEWDPRFARADAGQLRGGARSDVLSAAEEGVGSLKFAWVRCSAWGVHDLIGLNMDHGCGVELADVNATEM
jgi:hypothetical protein